MPFWMIALMIASVAATTVLSGLLQKLPKAKASSMGEMQAPTAEEGRNIPVIFGTCLLRAPNVVWYGDFGTQAIKVSAGWMAFGRKQTVGYRYYLGMDLHLCHGPVDALVDIRAGNGEDLVHVKYTTSQNSDGSIAVQLNDSELFGGDEKEGGINGPAVLYTGSQTQNGDSYMTGRIGAAYPAYRGISHMVLRRCYLGTSPYIKNLGVVLRRCPSNLGLLSAQSNINGDANPAEIIYEVLRNNVWGLGFPESRFDLSSFRTAAQTLATEGMGMSLQVSSPQQADALVETVLQHIDGVCYTDPETGLWTLKLVRAVNPATLPEFDADDIIECELRRGSWEDTVNEVKVKYTDRAKWKESIVQAQETANRAIRGEAAVSQVDFLGFSGAAIAQRAAMRELRVHSYPLAQGRIKINRKAWQWRMGTAFLLTWPPLGISKMPVRVVGINYGSLEKGEIEADVVEDVFGVSYTAYAPPTESEWINPIGEAQPPIAQLVQEAPYQVIESAERHIVCGAVRADGISTSYEVWTNDGGGYYHSGTEETFCPSGVLAEAYPENTAAIDNGAGIMLSSPADLSNVAQTTYAGVLRGDNILVIVNADGTTEWCGFQEIIDNEDGTYAVTGIARGIYDTVPISHAVGARVFIIRDGGVFSSGITRDTAYVANQAVNIKMLPRNVRGIAPFESVPQVSVTLSSRAAKPYPPGNVRVDGNPWPMGAIITGEATLSWAHRNRTAQAGLGVVLQDAASVSSGQEGTYKIEVLVNNVVKRTTDGITGTSWTYTDEMRTEDGTDELLNAAAFRITPVNGALAGTPRTTKAFILAPPGA